MVEAGRTVLLVEDDVVCAMATAAVLKRLGYAPVLAATGEEALRQAESGASLDLVLMDIDLGDGMDGIETAGRLLARHDIPVIFLSSHTEPEVVGKTETITSYGYLVKDVCPTVLDASIKMAFRLHEAKCRLKESGALIGKSEEKYRNLFDNATVGMLRARADGSEICDANQKFLDILGRTREETIGMPSRLIWADPADRAAMLAVLQSEGFINGLECRMRHKSGRTVDCIGSMRLYREQGMVEGSIVDISERTAMEAQVQRTNRFQGMLLEGTSDAFFALDQNLVFTFFNQGAEKALGISRGEVLGHRLFEAFPGAQGGEFERNFRLALHEHRTVSFEIHVEAGPYANWYEVRVHPLDDGVSVFFRIITERKRTEALLEENATKFRDMVWSMSVGVVVQGPRAEILLSNPKALELLGLSEDQLLGRTSFDPSWNVIHEDGRPFPGPDHPVPRAIATGKAVRDTIMGVYRPASGDRVWLLVDAVPQLCPDGSVLQVICTFNNITSRILADEQIRALLAEKELILREVHHRIKNNMDTIHGLLVLQAETLGDPASRASLVDAASRVGSMMLLYDKLYQAVDCRNMSLRDYLPPLVQEIIHNYPDRTRVRTECAVEDLPMEAKTLQCLGILVNELISNCMKYSFRGRPGGLIRLSGGMAEGQVRIIVGDDGIGLPESVSLGQSSGYGLLLVSTLAGQLGGTIRIERGGGTRFILEFPYRPPD